MSLNSMHRGNNVNYDIPELWNTQDDPYSKHLTPETLSQRLDRSLSRRRILLVISLPLALALIIIVVLTTGTGEDSTPLPVLPTPPMQSSPNSAPISSPVSLPVSSPVSSPISSPVSLPPPLPSEFFSSAKMYQFSFFNVYMNMEYYLQYNYDFPDFPATVDVTPPSLWILDGESSSSSRYDILLAPSNGEWAVGAGTMFTVNTANKGLYAWQITPIFDNKYIISSSMDKGCLALFVKMGNTLEIDSTGSNCIAWKLTESAEPVSFFSGHNPTEERAGDTLLPTQSPVSSSLFDDVVVPAGDMTSSMSVRTWRASNDEVAVETPLAQFSSSDTTTTYRISFVDASQVKWYLTYNNDQTSSLVYVQSDAHEYGTLWKLQDESQSYQIVSAETDGEPVLAVDENFHVVATSENNNNSYPWEFIPWPDNELFDIQYFFSDLSTGCMTVANDDTDISPSFGIITFDENDCLIWNIEASD